MERQFIATLPTKGNQMALGESKQMALRRFYNLGRKFANQSKLYNQYKHFINE